MRLLKGLGSFAGKVAGGVVGGGLEAVGTAVGSNFLKEVGQGVYNTTVRSGEMLGSLGDSAVTTVHGIVTEDGEKVKEGIGEAGNVVKTTAIGIGRTLASTATNASLVVNGVINDDLETARRGVRELAKTVVISSLSIGLCDVVFDIVDEPLVATAEMGDNTIFAANEIVSDIDVAFLNDAIEQEVDFYDASIQEPDAHLVDPHWVNDYYKADGTHVEGYWRDGDGDTSVNLSTQQGGGYMHSNPLGLTTA